MRRAHSVTEELKQLGTPAKARASRSFFKTGKGQYGHGDVFFGVTVPEQRKIAKHHVRLPIADIANLLNSKVHECRLTAILILAQRYVDGDENERERIARFYLLHKGCINNWDLVDSSAPYILGRHLLDNPRIGSRAVLYKLARSQNLWERRIGIIATHAFIRKGQYDDALKISALLLTDAHDLIHKAVGWTLREVGNRAQPVEERFLKKYAARMPRTMLRYAIEKFPTGKRKAYRALRYTRMAKVRPRVKVRSVKKTSPRRTRRLNQSRPEHYGVSRAVP